MKRRFFRANLPNIVWNPELKKPLAEFRNGQFTTEDETVAEKLLEMGYVEIDVDATKPPVMPDPPIQTDEVNVPLMGRKQPEPSREQTQTPTASEKEIEPEDAETGDLELNESDGSPAKEDKPETPVKEEKAVKEEKKPKEKRALPKRKPKKKG